MAVTLQTTLRDPVTQALFAGLVTITPTPQAAVLLDSDTTTTGRARQVEVLDGALSVVLDPGNYTLRWSEVDPISLRVDAEMTGTVGLPDVTVAGTAALPDPNGLMTNDARYYTEAEMDAAMAQKSDTDHTHDDRYYLKQPIDAALSQKADLVNGKVPLSQLPAVAGGLELGETDDTAYRGDRGKVAYDHSQDTTTNPHAVTAAQTGADPAGTAAAAVSAHAAGTGVHSIAGVTGLQTALDGKADTSHNHDGTYDPAGSAAAAQAAVQGNLDTHEADTANPHAVTKAQVGLGSADNTADADKPVSTAQQAALDGKADTSHNHDGTYDPAGTAAAAVAAHAAGTGVHSIAGVTGLQTALDALMARAIQVTALPASPTRGQPYELTQADDTALAAPGFYIDDGSGWFCFGYSAPYNLGNLTGAVSKTLITGLEFIAAVTGDVTSFVTTLTITGRIGITYTDAGGNTVPQPTMAGRTAKLLSSTAWDDAAGSLVKAIIEDDGTYLWASASEGT